ncbi:MAG: hypothetical protein NXH75_00195, partial [Halobacteriovoraceae bacterium]|nr:hypothetical protein [Halobacteriovoraceae bacterium]
LNEKSSQKQSRLRKDKGSLNLFLSNKTQGIQKKAGKFKPFYRYTKKNEVEFQRDQNFEYI